MIRCEHCGSMLPDGAIFCGECGRSVNVSANRRPAPAAPVDDTPPPPLRQPDQHGRRPDPAAEAWLPEATLDPATRAWLTGEDRQRSDGRADDRPAAPAAPVVPPAAPAAPAAPVADVRSGAPEVEPALDPDAYPSAQDGAVGDGAADAERTRLAPAAEALPAPPEAPAVPVWAPPAAQQPPVAPSRPSWWVGRGGAAAEPPVDDQHDDPSTDERPRAGDTAVVEPLVDRRPAPTPLIAPGNGPATCPVCGHTLEPDDIFCAECGAVRPTVTAAFTGPVVPLPMARPDWAADDEIPVDDETSTGGSEGDGDEHGDADPGTSSDGDRSDGDRSDGAPSDGAPSDGAPSDGDRPDGGRAAGDLRDGGSDREDAALPQDRTDSTPPVQGRHLADDQDATPDAPRGARVEGTVPPAPASPTVPTSPSVDGRPDLPPVPRAAPLPPIPGTTGPVLPPVGTTTVPSSGDPDVEEDVEETRIVVKTTSDAPFVLHFSTGERTAVHGTGLLGRLPRPQPGERFDDLLTVHDPGKSVSKTHLELGRDGDDLWVSDRHSGNGTVVRHIDGSIRRCEPGRRYRVERGARVDIGEQFFLVQ